MIFIIDSILSILAIIALVSTIFIIVNLCGGRFDEYLLKETD